LENNENTFTIPKSKKTYKIILNKNKTKRRVIKIYI